MMVAAISATPSQNNPKTPHLETHHHHQNPYPTRPPLLPSEKDNGLASHPVSRRPKTREITSRYMSSFSSTTSSSSSTSSSSYTSRRLPSPLVSRPAATPEPSSAVKRYQSVERRRSAASRLTTPLPNSKLGSSACETPVAASKMLWTSTRSLSVSFQGESFPLSISKVKAATPPSSHPNSNVRKATPERRRTTPVTGTIEGGGSDQLENSKPFEQQHRWPTARAQQQLNLLTRSLDCSREGKIVGAPRSVIRALQQSLIDDGRRVSFDSRALRQSVIDEVRRVSFDGRLSLDSPNAGPEKSVHVGLDADSTTSDSESVSSSSNSGSHEFSRGIRPRATPRGIVVPARFWQETNSRLRRLQEPGSPLTTNGSRTTMVAPKPIQSRKAFSDSSQLFSPRTGPTGRALSSPVPGPVRPSSPGKPMVSSSPSGRMPSPSRVRNSAGTAVNSLSCNMPSILTFAADVRRGKMGENRIEEAHLLRLLYNRHLQWRFVNARADAAMSLQRSTVEKSLYNAWITASKLRDSVTIRRIRVQQLRQNLKLTTILKGQMPYLEEWLLLDRDHSSSLTGASEALKASTLRLPVISGARADIEEVKDAVGSAVDVMQAMASSICSLLSKVDGMNSLVADVASLALQEQALLTQCKDLLLGISAMQVEECSLRTHLLQLRCMPTRTQL